MSSITTGSRHALKRRAPRSVLTYGLAICLLGSKPLGADDAAWQRLADSVQATLNVACMGVRDIVTFHHGRKVAGFQQKVIRMPGGRERIVVLYPPHLRGRLRVCNGIEVWEYWPHENKVVHQPLYRTPPADPTAEQLAQRLRVLDSLRRTLYAAVEGSDRVAGRACYVIALRDCVGQLVRKVWLDADTSIALKVQRFAEGSSLVYSSYYKTIHFDPKVDASIFVFDAPASATVLELPAPPARMTLAEAQARAGFQALLPQKLPAGYVLQDDQVAISRSGGQMVLWLPFSNGVDTFSIFESPAPLADIPNHHDGVFTWQQDGLSVLLVGILSPQEVRQIQQSMTRNH